MGRSLAACSCAGARAPVGTRPRQMRRKSHASCNDRAALQGVCAIDSHYDCQCRPPPWRALRLASRCYDARAACGDTRTRWRTSSRRRTLAPTEARADDARARSSPRVRGRRRRGGGSRRTSRERQSLFPSLPWPRRAGSARGRAARASGRAARAGGRAAALAAEASGESRRQSRPEDAWRTAGRASRARSPRRRVRASAPTPAPAAAPR